MYIDLGNDNFVPIDDIVAIIDSKQCMESLDNQKILLDYEKNGKIVNCTRENYVKSYVFCEGKEGKVMYSSSFTTNRLKDRLISRNFEI